MQTDRTPGTHTIGPVEELNRLIRENRIGDYRSPNLALGMRPLAFEKGIARWAWDGQPQSVLNPFGTIQGGFIAVMIDEMFSTAIGSVLDAGAGVHLALPARLCRRASAAACRVANSGGASLTIVPERSCHVRD